MEGERVIKRCEATSTPRGRHESSKSSSSCCVHSQNSGKLSPARDMAIVAAGQRGLCGGRTVSSGIMDSLAL
jgi:hypothetical protein